MKYPQLVPTRAVNAISDWLESRLEQLGVEAPQIYTRLLLSLLQSTVQINDPIEFNNLEQFFNNHKSGTSYNKRHLPCDTDTLKKLNAIQCLREIVCTEAELASIEHLVDELYDKLKSLDEQQSTETEAGATAEFYQQQQKQQQKELGATQVNISVGNAKSGSTLKATNFDCAATATTSSSRLKLELDSDPKQRYFRAFPALNKEMENSFLNWRPNAKSLTWPIVEQATKKKSVVGSSSSGSSSSSSSSSCSNSSVRSNELTKSASASGVWVGINALANVQEKQKQQQQQQHQHIEQAKSNDIVVPSAAAAANLKRKSRRRRNQALSKSLRFNTIAAENAAAAVAERRTVTQRRNDAAYWDTDFEGCWEMGRDLIKEFIIKQNNCGKRRNRSTSESAAYGLRQSDVSAAATAAADKKEQKKLQQQQRKNEKQAEIIETERVIVNDAADAAIDAHTLAAVLELTEDNAMQELAAATTSDSPCEQSLRRRLYQRELLQPKFVICAANSDDDDNNDYNENGGAKSNDINTDVHKDIAKLKAKFDSSVEALWKDATVSNEPQSLTTEIGAFSLNETDTFAAIAPAKEQLKNFWTNYYNHNFDANNLQQCSSSSMSSSSGKLEEQQQQSLNYNTQLELTAAGNTSDYHSMPSSNLLPTTAANEYEQQECIGGANIFLSDSIWTTHTTSLVKDNWPTSNQRQQQQQQQQSKVAPMQFLPYNASKWSEGINAGPVTMQQQQQLLQPTLQLHPLDNSSSNSYGADCTDSSAPTSVSAISWSSSISRNQPPPPLPTACFATNSWQTPVIGSNMPTDLRSWSAANPTALTKMYSSSSNNNDQLDGSALVVGSYLDNGSNNSNNCSSSSTTVTLLNHSSSSSCFVEYARIKSNMGVHKQYNSSSSKSSINQSAMRYANDDENLLTSERTHFYPIKSYADGYTFDICSALEVLNYERSTSGCLYLEKERYLEYVRNDNFMLDEDAAAASAVGASAMPLYASSNCEAAKQRIAAANVNANLNSSNSKQFIVKFRQRNCEVACQTEPDLLAFEMLPKSINFNLFAQYPLCLVFNNSAYDLRQTTAAAEAIAALNCAVEVVAKATAIGGSWQNQLTATAAADIDEVDAFETEIEAELDLEKQWSMREIGKKCQQKGHDNGVDNAAAAAAGVGVGVGVVKTVGDTPSLWTMCTACNNEFKSAPANHLLRAELKLDGDEIMSDLRYMQDMYIGRHRYELDDINSDSEWDADDDSCVDETAAQTAYDCENIMSPQEVFDNGNDEDDDADDKNRTLQVNEEVLQKVNRLIADLLRNESAAAADAAEYQMQLTVADEEAEAAAEAAVKAVRSDIWSNDYAGVERAAATNIWQQTAVADGMPFKPLELFRCLNVAADGAEETLLHQQQQLLSNSCNADNWEHAHLKEIWQRETPAAFVNKETTAALVNKETSEQNAESEAAAEAAAINEQIASKNLKNLQDNAAANESSYFTATRNADLADVDVVDSNVASAVFYKRMQQFLNSTAAANAGNKLKHCNRKRRHSASQNLLQHLSNAVPSYSYNNNSNNNNNNVNIIDLNRFNFKMVQLAAPLAIADDQQQQQQNNNNGDYMTTATVAAANTTTPTPSSQTFFTCKYWTTIDPLLTADELNMSTADLINMVNAADVDDVDLLEQNDADAAAAAVTTTKFSCLIDKNATILKHVAMVARPLTR